MTVNQITPGAMPLCANIFLKEIYYNEEIKKIWIICYFV